MKKSFLALAILAVAMLPLVAVTPADPMKDMVAKMNSADALSVAYTVQKVGDAAQVYDITLQKPNKAKVVTPMMTMVADGTTITTYLKGMNKYYSKPQTDAALAAVFVGDELGLWKGFFDAKAFEKNPGKDGGTVNRKGKKLSVVKVTVDSGAGKTMTLNIDPTNGLPVQAQIELAGKANDTKIIQTTYLALAAKSDAFAFKAPSGSEETTEAELTAARWLSYDEAMVVAKQLNRPVYIHFTADWCHWCHKIEDEVYVTSEFKEVAAKMVLCRVDIDKETALKEKFQVGGIPDIRVLNPDGSERGKLVGYQPAGPFVDALKKFL